MKKNCYSFFNFLGDILDIIINDTGKHADPYNINFTNHYKTLYNIESKLKQECGDDVKISEIVQNKKNKSLTVKMENVSIDKTKLGDVEKSFTEQNIECNFNGCKLDSFVINKKSKGVLEEREWQK